MQQRDGNKELFERQFDNYQHDDEYVGEITNERLKSASPYDHGMPPRSSFVVRKPRYDINTHLDFDLHEKVDTSKVKLSGNDTNVEDYADINETMTTLTRGTDPVDQCVGTINSASIMLNNQMCKLYQSDYVVSGFAIISLFTGIYLSSHDNLERELKNYFGFVDKKHTHVGMLRIFDEQGKLANNIKFVNYVVSEMQNSPEYTVVKKYGKFFNFVEFNKLCIKSEEAKLNTLTTKMNNMSKLISANTLSLMNVGLIATCKINPTWAYKINSFQGKFNGRVHAMGKFLGKTFDYFEDKDCQIVEIPFDDDNGVLGLINRRAPIKEPVDHAKLTYCMNYLRPTILNEVTFPLIQKRYKTRLTKIMKRSGLSVIFSETSLSSIFPNGCQFDDCVQYVDLLLENKCLNREEKQSGYKTTKKFVAQQEFEFYVKLKSLNMFLLLGVYR